MILKLDCKKGLNEDKAITLPSATFPYKNSAPKKVLYAQGTDYFTNKNSEECGSFTGCTLYAASCTKAYDSG